MHHTLDDTRYQDIRDAVRALCAEFPDEYHREVDGRRAYPEAFVDALTWAGWLSALIPQEYGGSGLGLVEASSATRWASMSVDTVWTLADADVVPRLLS